jgi:Holliday junction resolvasome RuvABC DNA-binding subunit
LSLKGKLVITDRKSSTNQATLTSQSVHKDLISALINLGFRPVDVEQAVADFPKDIDLQEGLRRGLSLLSGIN